MSNLQIQGAQALFTHPLYEISIVGDLHRVEPVGTDVKGRKVAEGEKIVPHIRAIMQIIETGL